MIALVTGQRDARYGGRLVGGTATGADVPARAGTATVPVSCRQALERLRDRDGVFSVVDAPDGYLTWQLTGPDGVVIAESPAVYRDAATCRAAFTDAQRAARTAMGGPHLRPLGSLAAGTASI